MYGGDNGVQGRGAGRPSACERVDRSATAAAGRPSWASRSCRLQLGIVGWCHRGRRRRGSAHDHDSNVTIVPIAI